MDNCKPINTPIELNLKLNESNDERTQKSYRELVGSLIYAAIATRPDICYAVNYLSRFQIKPTESHWVHLKRILFFFLV